MYSQVNNAHAVQLQGGTLRFGGDTAHIARESDFSEFITLSEPARLHRAMNALHDFLKRVGSVRIPARDLAQQRLVQLRNHLAA